MLLVKSKQSINRFSFSFTFLILGSPACFAQAATHPASEAVTQAIKKTATTTPIESLGPMLLGLIGILAVIFVLAGLLKKFTAFNLSSNQIKVLECQRIGTKEKLIIVNVQDKHLLLGVTPQNISHLCELDKPTQTQSSGMSFDKLMKQFLGQAKPNHLSGQESTKSTSNSKTHQSNRNVNAVNNPSVGEG